MKDLRIPEEDRTTVGKILDEFILPHQDRIARNTARQTKFFAHEKADACPICMAADVSIQEKVYTAFPFMAEKKGEKTEQEFFRLLMGWLQVSATRLMTGDDRIISIYPAFGCSAYATSLGMKQKRDHGDYGGYGPPDPLSREDALKLTIADVQIRGDLKKRLDFAAYAREMTGDRIPILCSYTGGPFTFACGVMGSDFMMLTAAEPQLAHEFLDFCIAASGKILMWLREAGGADQWENTVLGSGHVARGARLMQMDIDEAVMFSPDAIEEFVLPSARKFADACGLKIQMLHYCGWYEYFSRAIAKDPSIAAFNNNPVPLKNPPPYELVMRLCEETNTCYCGYWPQNDGESARDYLKRLSKWARKGILIPDIHDLSKQDGFSCSADVVDYWRQLCAAE